MLNKTPYDLDTLKKNSSILAYEDPDFINLEECRALRLHMEYLKPDIIMDAFDVQSTMVVFGSARTKSPEEALKGVDEARARLEAEPGSSDAMAALNKATRELQASHYYQVAREFALLVTRESQRQDKTDRTFVILTGGGGGIMEAANRGAKDGGGISASLNISLPYEQYPNQYITPELSFKLHYFSMRKMHFLKRAKGLACFPGGFGTMDELFEALTLVQTNKMPRMPILLFGREFWEKLINWDFFVERGLICPEDLKLFTYCETAQEGWDVIQKFYGRA